MRFIGTFLGFKVYEDPTLQECEIRVQNDAQITNEMLDLEKRLGTLSETPATPDWEDLPPPYGYAEPSVPSAAALTAVEELERHMESNRRAATFAVVGLDFAQRQAEEIDRLRNAAAQAPVSVSLGGAPQATAMPVDGREGSDPRRSNVPEDARPEPPAAAAPGPFDHTFPEVCPGCGRTASSERVATEPGPHGFDSTNCPTFYDGCNCEPSAAPAAVLKIAAQDLHDFLWLNVPELIEMSTASEMAGEGLKKRLNALKEALK